MQEVFKKNNGRENRGKAPQHYQKKKAATKVIRRDEIRRTNNANPCTRGEQNTLKEQITLVTIEGVFHEMKESMNLQV